MTYRKHRKQRVQEVMWMGCYSMSRCVLLVHMTSNIQPQAIKTTNVASYSTCFLVYWTSNVQGTRNECGIARCTACSFNAIARAYDHTKSVNIPLRVGFYMYIHTWWRKCNRGKRSCYRFCVMDNVYSTMVSFNSVDNVFARNWIIKNRFYFVRFSGV